MSPGFEYHTFHLILTVLFPVGTIIAIIHCFFNKEFNALKKAVLIIGQVIGYAIFPYNIISVIYGIFYIRPLLAKAAYLGAGIVLVVMACNIVKNPFSGTIDDLAYELSGNISSNLSDSPQKTDLLDNIHILQTEYKNIPNSDERAVRQLVNLGLVTYLAMKLYNVPEEKYKDGLSEEDYQAWRSLFYYRQTLDPNYVGKLTDEEQKKMVAP